MKENHQLKQESQLSTTVEKTHKPDFGELQIDYDKNTELIHKEEIPQTPFWIIGNQEKGYFLAMGNHKLCDTQKTIEQVKDYYDNHQWELTMQMAFIVFTDMLNQYQIDKKSLETN